MIIFLTESQIYSFENEQDIKFMSQSFNKKLIEPAGSSWKINFVGEVKTATNTYFSFPKNVYYDNIPNKDKLIDDLYKILSNKDFSQHEGRSLRLKIDGSFNTERYYFDILKGFYLDYITYGFIYPSDRIKKHSSTPIDGKISVVDTYKNQKRFGPGITYLTTDIENSDDWILDDIYYWTLQKLKDGLGVTKKESDEIDNVTSYLKESGHKINKCQGDIIISKKTEKQLLDLRNTEEVLKVINQTDVEMIHIPIKSVLLDYYKNKIGAAISGSVNVILTTDFELVWEKILAKSLGGDTPESKGFKQEISSRFTDFETDERILKNSEIEQLKNKYPITQDGESKGHSGWIEKVGNRYRLIEKGRRLMPDLFIELPDGRRFIGDAKYYKNTRDQDFSKEMGDYNDAQNNIYPMVIFSIPDSGYIDRTLPFPQRPYRRRRNSPNELIIINVCVQDVIDDALNGSRNVLSDCVYIINKYTRRKSWE